MVGIEPIPDNEGFIWEVVLRESYDVDGMPNLTKQYIGQSVSIYVPPDINDIRLSNNIEAFVAFRGDESGGAFYLAHPHVRKLRSNEPTRKKRNTKR